MGEASSRLEGHPIKKRTEERGNQLGHMTDSSNDGEILRNKTVWGKKKRRGGLRRKGKREQSGLR